MKFLIACTFLAVLATSSALKCFPVPKETTCVKAHEEYSRCGAHPSCQHSCDNVDGPLACVKICMGGCVCEDGYVKDAEGNCVKPEECPAIVQECFGAFEEYTDCGSACPLTCDNPTGEGVMCTMQCVQGCFCQEGYVRDKDNKCVQPFNCPEPEPLTCGENENYEICSTLCGEATCDRRQNFFCGLGCQQRCHCKEGYIRENDGGACILETQCPTQKVCARAFEEYNECGTACPLTCANKDNPPMFCTANCVPDCFCQEGYVRDSQDNCVKPLECPAPEPICSASTHEEYSECNAYCQRTCGPPTPCAAPPQDCNPGCVCEAGYVRENHGGACIPEDQCPNEQCFGAFEEYSDCGSACPLNCENPTGEGVACPEVCVQGCFCQKGYIRDANENCVLPKNCPKIDYQCDANTEDYSECGAHACLNTCAEPNLITYCDPAPGCYPGCVCKEGYLRDDNGICVEASTCPLTCSEQNEHYEACSPLCEDLKCTDREPHYCRRMCMPRCMCDEGYVRDSNNICIKECDCPAEISCAANEKYSECGANGCQNTCKNPTLSQVCRATCVEGCICKEGYIRDDNGICIEQTACPAVEPTCPEANEVYSECGANSCQKSCELYYSTINVACRPSCAAGCICKEGFIRNDNDGTCIKITECPQAETSTIKK